MSDEDLDTIDPQQQQQRYPTSRLGKREGKSQRSKALEKFKELKEKGVKRIQQYEIEEEEDIYELVDDRQYTALVNKRLKEDDFVVDDDGRGYADHGLEDWDEYNSEMDSSEGEIGENKMHQKTKEKKRKKKEGEKGTQQTKRISKAFLGGQKGDRTALMTMGSSLHSKETKEDLNLDSLLEDLKENPDDVKGSMPRKMEYSDPKNGSFRHKYSVDDLPIRKPHGSDRWNIKTAHLNDDLKDEKDRNNTNKDQRNIPNEVHKETFQQDHDFGACMDLAKMDEEKEHSTDLIRPIENPKPVSLLAESKKEVQDFTTENNIHTNGKDWWSICKQDMSEGKPLVKEEIAPENVDLPLENKSIKMYWFDAFEQSGTLYLFGKVWIELFKSYVSCCVLVKNIERNIFFLPRPFALNATGQETDEPVTMASLYEEIKMITENYKISKWATKFVDRKYAFEIPNVPPESKYMKMVYSFQMPQLPKDLNGRTFSRIFGSNTSALEMFLLKRKIMGPCWLEISNCIQNNSKISWCKSELVVEDPKNIKTIENENTCPPLVALSLSFKTIMNHQRHVNEIVMVSAIYHTQVTADGPTLEPEKQFAHFTAVRQLGTMPYPPGFVESVYQNGIKLEVCKTERSLLSYLIASIHRIDPDVIIGHNFIGFDFEILLSRLKEHKVDHWSRLGRLRRSIWPKLQSNSDIFQAERQLMVGRLVCDTYISAKDLIRQKNYTLTELALSQLNVERREFDLDKIPHFFGSSSDLFYLARYCENDAFIAISLMFSLMILPLSKQLTNLAGNLWSRTLMGARAERNEYLLLHEFHRLKYICPDKTVPKKSIIEPDELEPLDLDQEKPKNKTSKKKPAYAGGLVLEPKKGLYDKFVILLDFNSLYPSIIQEYNICFTTVHRTSTKIVSDEIENMETDDVLPNIPGPGLEQGVLPRVIKTLVERRRQVKSLISLADNTPADLIQLDIRQKALKLTANSMYGCLGFTHSRFYAKPLAMMITSLGRDTLQKAVDIAQTKLGLEVIYGDTDSIMICTGSEDLAEVKRIASSVKKEVNALYKKLEIDLDGIFQRLLLLKKKKYAALIVEEKKDGDICRKLEIKGLDLVRRDWCGLSHDVSNYVLEQLMSGKGKDDVLDTIHTYLRKVGEDIRQGQIPLDKFVINKSLTKAPEEYADAKSQPHVQVAVKMKQKGLGARTGDTIPYVICEGDKSLSYAQRAFHPDDLLKEDSGLRIDFDWYLKQQLHPPISRLCEPIEGTDSARIADCLGLDSSKFQAGAVSSIKDVLYTFSIQMSDSDRFRDVEKFNVLCLACRVRYDFDGVIRIQGDQILPGIQCPNIHCKKLLNSNSIITQATVAARQFIQRYYDSFLVCDDHSCRNRTRKISVNGRRCLVLGCKGSMQLEYSDTALYTQLAYFVNLFDVEHFLEINVMDDSNREKYRNLILSLQVEYCRIKDAMNTILCKNSRAHVDLKSLFSFCSA